MQENLTAKAYRLRQHVLDIIEIAFTHIEHKSHGEGCTCNCCRGEE